MLKKITLTLCATTAALSLAGCGINDIPSREENAKAKFADLQSAYQRRSDLIPNLVSTVQAAAKNERGILVEVTEARAKATSITVDAATVTDPAKMAALANAQSGMSSALGRLMVVVEKYPDIKSNQNFITLQEQLEGTENRINIARKDYNDAARVYNTTLRTFPTVVWASTIHSGSKPLAYFEAAESAKDAPKVDFSGLSPAPAPAPASAN